MKHENINYIGLKPNEIVNSFNALYVSFLETFNKPMKDVIINDVRLSWLTLQAEYKALRNLISEHKTPYYSVDNSNTIYTMWSDALRAIDRIYMRAYEIIKTRSWTNKQGLSMVE